MKKILGSLLFITVTLLHAGSMTATVDRDRVVEGDTVLLTLSVSGKNVSPIPDIEEVNGLKVLGIQHRQRSSMVFMNGTTRMERIYSSIIEFRPDANMTIPSFSAKVDGEVKKTKPIRLTIIKPTKGSNGKNDKFSIDVQLSKSKFYLGESIILNVIFKQRTNVNVLQVDYTPPKFKNFFSKQIGEGKSYRKGHYTIQELNYLIIAKKSGRLTLEPARAKVAEASRQRQMGGWYVNVPKWTQLTSPSLIVEVNAPSKAHDIVGEYRLTDNVDTLKVKSNKPVTLRVELQGKGTLDDYDGIEFDIPAVTIYSDDAKVESRLMGKELESSYSKAFVFISDHNFTIPSKEIHVFDYKSGEVKVLKTRAYQIEVERGAKAVSRAMVHTQTPATGVVSSSVVSVNEPWHKRLPTLLSLLFAFSLGVLATLMFQYLPQLNLLKWKKRVKNFRGEEALKVLYPKMGESSEVEEMVRKLYAIKGGDKRVEIDKERLKELVEQYR